MPRPYSSKEDAIIKKHYRRLAAEEIARRLQRSRVGILRRAQILGVRKKTRYWTPAEDELIRRLYRKVPARELAERLVRKERVIINRAYVLGIGRKIARWTPRDIHFLKKWYPSRGAIYVGQALGKSLHSVYHHARKYRVERSGTRRWLSEDDLYVKRWFGKRAPSAIARRLQRSTASVVWRARKLGLKLPPLNPPWTEREKDFLRNRFQELTNKELAKQLHRTPMSVAYMLGVLDLRRWRLHKWLSRERRYLGRMYHQVPHKHLAQRFGVSVGALRAVGRSLGLTKPNAQPYTSSERNTLNRLYGALPNRQLAQKMRRTVGSLEGQARKLRLTGKTPRTPRPMSDRESAFITANFGILTLDEIASALQRSRPSIAAFCAKKGLRKYKRKLFTKDEIAFLRSNYTRRSTRELAQQLDRSMGSITEVARHYGWTGSASKRKVGYAFMSALRKRTKNQ